jgi:hypothetical protein
MNIGLAGVLGLTVSGLLIAGCEKAPPRAIFTVNYYKTHEDVRRQKLQECQGNPSLTSNPDCVNASRAESGGN